VRCLLSHPHTAAVSASLAIELHRRGLLTAYHTGFAVVPPSHASLIDQVIRISPRLNNRVIRAPRDFPLRTHGVTEFVSRTGAYLQRKRPYDALFERHDRAVARSAWLRCDAAYAYEDAALATFVRAKWNAAACILDLAAPFFRVRETIATEERAKHSYLDGVTPYKEPRGKADRKLSELALADIIVCASEWSRRTLESAGVAKPIVVAPYGFPLEGFRFSPKSIDDRFSVISVGAHSVLKGTHYLLEAWRAFAESREVDLFLIGSLDPALKPLLSPTVTHIPHVPKARLQKWYERATVLVFPSLCDGFGLVMQEAMVCGTPIIGSIASGAPEIIEDGGTGWLVRPASVDDLIGALTSAFNDRERTRRMGVAARARAEHWTWRQSVDRLLRGLEAGGVV
jgi:starch synthase